MKKSYPILARIFAVLSAIFVCLNSQPGLCQDITPPSITEHPPGKPSADDRKLTVQLSLGALGTYPLGQSITRTREVFAEEGLLSDSVHSFRNTVWPAVFVSGGAEMGYRFSPRWRAVGGVRFARQGFSLRKRYTYTDAEYQYDEIYKSRIYYQINTIEIPLYIERQFGGRVSLGLGASVTAAVAKRQQKVIYSKNVVINGKKSEQDAVKRQEQVNDISSYTKGMNPTALLNLGLRANRHWGIQFRGQYSLNQYKEEAEVYNASAFLGLTYLF